MGWLFLLTAGLSEVVGVTGMNLIIKNKNAKAYIVFAIGFSMSFLLLSQAMLTLPMGTAYAVWTGIGTVGGALVGMFFYGESKDWNRILFITMVLTAAVGLKMIA
ncbi:DMT family transporter [Paenibacillus donghaensis]|uniref:QacE family quaternary ammonium compound efflux SMR transporter n=1 Tax=Paenibacillus donghaensis TaxID=414771 RepID=A0A2Z2KDT9_9BACL|nr:multidrug efflux SMR transporter [Paenibacillus donghaensis]ASA24906.1 QacE family quaternary ammonium compound efflux SMR transporter [Paenibacillus donghaensis]